VLHTLLGRVEMVAGVERAGGARTGSHVAYTTSCRRRGNNRRGATAHTSVVTEKLDTVRCVATLAARLFATATAPDAMDVVDCAVT